MSSLSVPRSVFGSALLWGLLAVTACGGKPGTTNSGSEGGGDSGGSGNGTSTGSGGVALGNGGSTARNTSTEDSGGEAGAGNTVVAECGDGVFTAGEACDDGNETDGDGCAGDCQSVDADYACPTPGEPCVPVNVCGDKKITGTENCDDGNGTDGDGCSSACRQETGFNCTVIGAICQPICGDGLVRGSEQCDDGGTADDDGCTATCTVQGQADGEGSGWVCTAADSNSPSVCTPTTCGNGTKEGTEQCDQSNNDMGDGCTPFCRLEPTCSYDAAGCTSVCGDGFLLSTDTNQQCDDGNNVSGDGCSADCSIEAGFLCPTSSTNPSALLLPVVYRDFKKEWVTNGHPDFEAYGGWELGIVQSQLDDDKKPAHVTDNRSTTSNVYSGGVLTSPRDYFSYWYRDDSGTATNYNKTVVQTLRLDPVTSGFQFADTTFFPLDGLGWNDSSSGHNFFFTSEVRYWFQYQGGESLEFIGDDDVWVFVNGRLTVDLGGVHTARAGKIVLGTDGTGTVETCTDGDDLGNCSALTTSGALDLQMTLGNVYEIVVFQAERHTSESNYKLTLGSFNANRSDCDTVCGDAFVTPDEACDLGAANNTGAYGTCNDDCTLPAYCGNGAVDASGGEVCDNGVNLATYGYNGTPACNANCQLTDYCGDSIVDSLYGEECDDGNAESGDGCEANCTHRVDCGDGTVNSGEECDDGNLTSGDGCSEFCTEEDDIILT